MATYRVEVIRLVPEYTYVEVEAADEAEAQNKAISLAEDRSWDYGWKMQEDREIQYEFGDEMKEVE